MAQEGYVSCAGCGQVFKLPTEQQEYDAHHCDEKLRVNEEGCHDDDPNFYAPSTGEWYHFEDLPTGTIISKADGTEMVK